MLVYVREAARTRLRSSFLVAYADLLSARCHTSCGLLRHILRQLSVLAAVEETWALREEDSLTSLLATFEAAVEEIAANGFQAVVCLDEFESLIRRRAQFPDDFFHSLRSLASAGKLAFVTASQTPLRTLFERGELVSPFWNLFGRVELGEFTEEESVQFVTTPRPEVQFNEDEVKLILAVGGRHPQYLQIACWHVFEAKRQASYDAEGVRRAAQAEIDILRLAPQPQPAPEELPAPPPLRMAHVMFMDIVGYSKLPGDRQAEVAGELNQVVLDSPTIRNTPPDELLLIPTGDGMVVCFFANPEAPLTCSMEVKRALAAHNEGATEEYRIPTRMGLHVGPVFLIRDINMQQNLAGGGINIAQRVMDLGDDCHILASRQAYEMLSTARRAYADLFHGLGSYRVKHDLELEVYNVYDSEVGNPAPLTRGRSEGTRSS